ncbi:uncharacterized protein LOC143027828 isoform X3 [Oratosquilla oratoria]|uniref:uncharacterized protein LOC143027828 isoform X3 n=1 Tax=Oratosquilla oratoria TaxID=337810 RepID=UPI003F75EC24
MNDPFVQRMMGKVAQHRAKVRQLAAEVDVEDKENLSKVSSETRLRLNKINSLYEEESSSPLQSTDNERNIISCSESKVGLSPTKCDASSSSLNKAALDEDTSEVRKSRLGALARRTKQLNEWEDDYTYHSTSRGSQVVVGRRDTLHDSVALHSGNKDNKETLPTEEVTSCSKLKTNDSLPFTSEATKASSSPSRYYFGGGVNPDLLGESNFAESSVDSLTSSHSSSSYSESSSVLPSPQCEPTHTRYVSSTLETPINACKSPHATTFPSGSQLSVAQAFATACKSPFLSRTSVSQPSLAHKPTQRTPTKKLAWDHRMLNSLEAQGFTPTESNSRLIYDFKKEQGAQELDQHDKRHQSPEKNVTTTNSTSSSGCEMSQSLYMGASMPSASVAAANLRANVGPKIVTYHPKSPVPSPEHRLSQATSQKHRSRDLSPSKVNDLKNQWEKHIREASPERKPGPRQPSPTRAVVRSASPAKAASHHTSPERKPFFQQPSPTRAVVRTASPAKAANHHTSPERKPFFQQPSPSPAVAQPPSPARVQSPIREHVRKSRSQFRETRSPNKVEARPPPVAPVVKGEAVVPASVPVVEEGHMSSVKARAAAFDMAGGVRTSPRKDPAELSLKERLGLFEKQKDGALVPKAPFGQAVPSKALVDDRGDKTHRKSITPAAKNYPVKNLQKEVPSTAAPVHPPAQATSSIAQKVEAFNKGMRSPSPTRCGPNTIHTHRRLFEQMQEGNWKENEINSKIQTERQREMEVLLNRFKKPANKIKAQAPQSQIVAESETEYPESDEDSALESTSFDEDLNAVQPQGPPKPPRLYLDMPDTSSHPPAPPLPKSFLMNRNKAVAKRLNSTEISEAMHSPGKEYVPRIKPGFMYPALSDVETHSEAPESQESDFEDEKESSFAESVLTCASLHSLGTRIQKSAIGQSTQPLTPVAEGDSIQSKYTMSESTMEALDAIDDAIDEALDEEGELDGPTPPKRGRSCEDTPGSSSIYKTPKFAGTPSSSVFKTPKLTAQSAPEELSPDSSLIHSVSMYRKQKPEQITYTPVRQVKRQDVDSPGEALDSPSIAISARIKELQDEVCAQQNVISQASGAISVVSLRPELKGSTQHVEAERLLLISCQKRQAALNEIQRLKTEGAMGERNWASGTNPDSCHGSISISNIALPLKQDFVRKGTGSTSPHHLVLLVKHRDQVISSELLTTPGCIVEGCVTFPNLMVLHNLASNFSIALEVYCLKTGADCSASVKKEHSRLKLTPLKRLHKSESRTPSSPMLASPGGPHAVRTPAFQMVGFTHLNILTLTRNAWTLEQVPFSSPLSGHLLMNVSCSMEGGITERGFLTMFEDVGGYGAWNRRWCILQGTHLCCWMYPDDEKKKEPSGTIDLRTCTTRRVELVPRNVCARQHTFQLTCVRPATKGDTTNLVQEVRGSTVVSKLLLSADCKEERILWCNQLNKALANIRAWDPDALRSEDYQV